MVVIVVQLQVPTTCVAYGNYAFNMAYSGVWNKLPVSIFTANSLPVFD